MMRLDVRKTYKLYIGGSFPRSESGRTYEVLDAKGRFVANASKGSRKDARDAVLAARNAFAGWSTRTPYNRGQIIYRIAEVLEGRRDQFVASVRASEGLNAKVASSTVDAAIDRLVWYAGWADKLGQVVGNANPVSGPLLQPVVARTDRSRRHCRFPTVVAARARLGARTSNCLGQHRGGRVVLRPAAAGDRPV